MQYTLYKKSTAGWVFVKELQKFDEATYVPQEDFRVERRNAEGYHTIIGEVPDSPVEEDVLTPETIKHRTTHIDPITHQVINHTLWNKVKSVLQRRV